MEKEELKRLEGRKHNRREDAQQDLLDQDGFGRVPGETYKQNRVKQGNHTNWDECFRQQMDLLSSIILKIQLHVNEKEELFQQQQTMLQNLGVELEPVIRTSVVESVQEPILGERRL